MSSQILLICIFVLVERKYEIFFDNLNVILINFKGQIHTYKIFCMTIDDN